MEITSSLFQAYLQCSTKCWLRAVGEVSTENSYAEWVKTQDESYRVTGTQRLIDESTKDEVATSPLLENLESVKWLFATSVLAQTQMDACLVTSCLHAVEHVPSDPQGKPARLIPVRFIFRNKLTKDDKLLIGFDALALSETIGRDVSLGKIIHGDHHALLRVKTSPFADEARKRLEEAAALLSSPAPPDLVLNRHCAECEFRDRCRQKALTRDDLSLLAGMSGRERQKLRSKGIFAVTQLSYAFRPRRRPRRLRDKREKYHHALKALAIREKKIHMVGSPEFKFEGTPVYLDVEGLPDRDFYYLIGVRVGSGDYAVQHSLWAETVADESKIWRQFIRILETIERPVLIHYGNYETIWIRRMCNRHGGPPKDSVATAALASTVNLLSLIFAQIYFPTYSNGLKDVARWLGFKWSSPMASGLQAICWREDCNKSERTLKKELVSYNSDDCAALATVSEAIAQVTAPGETEVQDGVQCVRTDSLKPELASRYREFVSQIPEFEKITEAAHWNCQRDQVRWVPKKKRSTTRLPRRSLQSIDKEEFVDVSRHCPRCGSKACNKQRLSRRICDELLFGRASLKARRIRTVFQVYFCRSCRRHFGTLGHSRVCRKFGWNLRAFFLYLVIEVNVPQFTTVRLLNRLFGIAADRTSMNTVKKYAAAYYRDTYQMIKERILSGHVLHVDETRANVQGKSAYVWVLTSLEDVIYVYSDTREGEMIQQLLSSFRGVLVSDFYAVYDAIPCEHQKCLVHLVRDLNDDLFANPFDEELRHLAESFGVLIGGILETVQRRGLKKYFLRKHVAFVRRFYNTLELKEPRSEVALRWRARLTRNKETLFAFLHYDGVPWNNNNAEHAIKAFARLRKTIAGSSTVGGLADYLILLSVSQTCKYTGVDFLDFLRSGEKDIHVFGESEGRRRKSSPLEAMPIQS
jgi:predicted RecB family nuclease